MEKEIEKIWNQILENKIISKKLENVNLTEDQIIDALPIFIDMINENDDKNTKYLTSFSVKKNGYLKRINVFSTFGKKFLYKKNVVTEKIQPINFEEKKKFLQEEPRKLIIQEFSKILKNKKQKFIKGFYLYGEMGIGKTFIFKRFCKILAENNKKVGFINLSNLIQILKSTFDKNSLYNSQNILSLLQDAEYLFIDDIGAEKVSSWFRDDFLFNLLNFRMENKKITFFSSNYSIDNLLKKQSLTENSQYRDYDKAKRLISRIKALSIEIKLIGNNKRY